MRTLLVVICTLLCAASLAQSPKDKEHPHKSEGPQRGTKSAPVFTEGLMRTQAAKEASAQESTQREAEAVRSERSAKANEAVARYTEWMVYVMAAQAAFFVWQLGMMRVTLRDTKAAADAAKVSADAAKASADSYKNAERGWVSWTRIEYNPFTDCIGPNGEKWATGMLFVIHWLNAGRTPALKCNLFCIGRVVPHGQPLPVFVPDDIPHGHQAPVVPQMSVSSRGVLFPREQIDAMIRNECQIFLYGRVDYEDLFSKGVSRHAEVCFAVEFGGYRSDNNAPIFQFRAAGPQNSVS